MTAELQAFRSGRRRVAAVTTAAATLFVAAVAAGLHAFALPMPPLFLLAGLALLAAAYAGGLRGGASGRAWLRGAFAGLLPLGASLLARGAGHLCAGGQCFSACVPICAAATFGAAAWVARDGVHRRFEGRAFVIGGVSLVAVGSLGCGCVAATGALATAVTAIAIFAPATALARRA